MKVTSTYISGLKIIQTKNYKDNRGSVKESFKQKILKIKILFLVLYLAQKKML